MEQNHLQPPGMPGGQSSTNLDPANAAALSITHPTPDATMHSADTIVPPAGAPPPPYRIERKKRIASAETLAQFAQAEDMRELVLIFDTSKGKKGAYGGLGHDAREEQERTIDDIIEATTPGIKYEQKRIDQINVYDDHPTYYIVLLVPTSEAHKALGPQPEVHKTITYHIHGRDQSSQLRSDVSIIVTTPDRVPHLKMFGDRANKALPAGGLLPGIPIVMYLQDTRQNFLNIPDVLKWLTEDIMEDLNTVLTYPLQPTRGFTIEVAPGQPSRLASRTGTVGMGISIKFYLIAPPPLDPRNIESVTGLLLPNPVLMPRCYVKTPGTAAYVSEWDYHPDDPSTQLLSRAERCRGGSRGLGDGVTVRYIAPTYSSGTPLVTSTDNERFLRLGPYDPETDAIEGLETQAVPKHGTNERRKLMRDNAAKKAKICDPAALRAHKAAQEAVYFTEVCQKALERISAPNGNLFIPAALAQQAASTLDPPAELLAAACHNATCKTQMCMSLRKIASAVVDARVDGRAHAANRLTAAKIDAEITAMGPKPREPRESFPEWLAEGTRQPNPPNPHYGAGAPTMYPPSHGKGGGKGKGKGKGSAPVSGKGSAPASAKGKTPVYNTDRLRATDGTGVHGNVRPTTPPDERRFDQDGSGPHTKQQFYQHYQSLAQWNAAYGRAEMRPQGRLTHPPHVPETPYPPNAGEASSSESHPKAARTRIVQPFSPGRSPAVANESLTIHEHGSNLPPAAPIPSQTPVVYGWTAPFPSEGDMNPQNAWIVPSLRNVTNKLARGLYQLMSLSTQRSPEGRILIHHEAITEYLTSPSNGEPFSSKYIDDLLEALEQAYVLTVHTLPAAQYGGDEQYYYDFILAPLVHPSMDTNDML